MIEFILNNKFIRTKELSGTILLDFIRKKERLYGVKIGCREGDCGACTVLVGTLGKSSVKYETVVSCLTPIGNVSGKHVVTIEGINGVELTCVQSAMVEENATQCGFCTPGFVVSLTAFSLSGRKSEEEALASIAGNICRCTGYKSIERAAKTIVEVLSHKDTNNPINWLISNNFIPSYFKEIPERLKCLNQNNIQDQEDQIMGGGTDLYVQKPDELSQTSLYFTLTNVSEKIFIERNKCVVHGSATVSDLYDSKILNDVFPRLKKTLNLVSSEQIRNMGTVAGNFVNASPIGDLSIMFLVLNAQLEIKDRNQTLKNIWLCDFFKAYKEIELKQGDLIESLKFSLPPDGFYYNFEKVSKRKYLDIASVNTAIYLNYEHDLISDIKISIGGVSPIPLLLTKTSAFLMSKEINPINLRKAIEVMTNEINPIDDIRGSSAYKMRLAKQLITQHFIHFFPKKFKEYSLRQ